MFIEAAGGQLYWMLVKLRNFPSGYVELTVIPQSDDETELGRCDMDIGTDAVELHHRYFDWVKKFSDHELDQDGSD